MGVQRRRWYKNLRFIRLNYRKNLFDRYNEITNQYFTKLMPIFIGMVWSLLFPKLHKSLRDHQDIAYELKAYANKLENELAYLQSELAELRHLQKNARKVREQYSILRKFKRQMQLLVEQHEEEK